MATDLGKAYVQIIPSAKGISGAISSELGGEATSAGKSAGLNIAGAIKGAIAAAGIGTAIKSALDAGGNLQQSFGGLDTLYGEAADAAKAYAVEAAQAGISANSYAEQAVSFGAALKQAFAGDTVAAAEAANTAILDMADNSAKMGTDITSIQTAYQGFAKQNYTMLDNLKLGYGGTKAEMERLLEDATKLSGVEYNLDNLGDVYAAIHVIQEDLGLTGVAAEEASSTFTGSLGAMKAAGENLLANLALGEDIGPSLDTLGETVQTFVFNNLVPMLGNIAEALPELVSGIGSLVIQMLNQISLHSDEIVQTGIEIVTALVEAIVEAAPYLAEAAINLIASLAEALINTDWVQVGTDLINNLRDSIDLAAGEILGLDSGTIDSFLGSITAGLPDVLASGVEMITNLANGILESLPSMIEAAGELVNSFLDFFLENYPTILKTGADLLLNLVKGIVDNLPKIIESVVKIVAKFTATFAEHLPEILKTGIELMGKLIAGIIETIPKLVAALPKIFKAIIDAFGEVDWLKLGADIISGIIEGIGSALSSLVEAAVNAARAAFEAAKDFLGINSPSKEFMFIGKMTDEGFALGIEQNKKLVNGAISDLSESATAQLQTASANYDFQTPRVEYDERMDVLLDLLDQYLPEIASNKGLTPRELFNGINRQLGVAIS